MSMLALPDHLQQRLRDELKPGESVVWAGQPVPGRYMRGGFWLWLFFAPWTAFAVFWIAGAASFTMPRLDGAWSLFPLFGLPFLLIGLGGMSSPFLLRRKARSMVYAITSQRALVIEGRRSVTVRSYPAAVIGGTQRTQHPDGTGDLVLRTGQYTDSDGDSRTTRQGFFAVPDVRRVEQLVEALRASHAQDGG